METSTAAAAGIREQIANTIRFLSADGVQKANSGHPGMPMGCAEIATVLLTKFYNVDPEDPSWINRGRCRSRPVLTLSAHAKARP